MKEMGKDQYRGNLEKNSGTTASWFYAKVIR